MRRFDPEQHQRTGWCPGRQYGNIHVIYATKSQNLWVVGPHWPFSLSMLLVILGIGIGYSEWIARHYTNSLHRVLGWLVTIATTISFVLCVFKDPGILRPEVRQWDPEVPQTSDEESSEPLSGESDDSPTFQEDSPTNGSSPSALASPAGERDRDDEDPGGRSEDSSDGDGGFVVAGDPDGSDTPPFRRFDERVDRSNQDERILSDLYGRRKNSRDTPARSPGFHSHRNGGGGRFPNSHSVGRNGNLGNRGREMTAVHGKTRNGQRRIPRKPRKRSIFCTDCGIPVTEDSYHCEDCDVCIDGFDHHCPWTSKCVGGKNINEFHAFVSIGMISLFFVAIMCGTFVHWTKPDFIRGRIPMRQRSQPGPASTPAGSAGETTTPLPSPLPTEGEGTPETRGDGKGGDANTQSEEGKGAPTDASEIPSPSPPVTGDQHEPTVPPRLLLSSLLGEEMFTYLASMKSKD
mmetsp:Transcript_42687/g.84207  ORF Transcript_42687/g.84207 Transcript_42687/m.84207 type:complete len:462 (-) Transcript_42687:80-1465(-)